MPRALKITTSEFEQYNPYRSLAWRWKWALERAGSQRHGNPDGDLSVQHATEYLRALDGATTSKQISGVNQRMPEVTAARHIFVTTDIVRDQLEAYLLAGVPFEQLAAMFNQPLEVIRLYESLFFSVCDAPDAADWLLEHAVGIDRRSGQPPTEGQVWKYWGFRGGPVVVDLLIADFLNLHDDDITERHRVAEGLRYLVGLWAIWDSPGTDRAKLLEEGRPIFDRVIAERPAPEKQLLKAHMNILRLSERLPIIKDRGKRKVSQTLISETDIGQECPERTLPWMTDYNMPA